MGKATYFFIISCLRLNAIAQHVNNLWQAPANGGGVLFGPMQEQNRLFAGAELDAPHPWMAWKSLAPSMGASGSRSSLASPSRTWIRVI